jgi:hypothetical protein
MLNHVSGGGPIFRILKTPTDILASVRRTLKFMASAFLLAFANVDYLRDWMVKAVSHRLPIL